MFFFGFGLCALISLAAGKNPQIYLDLFRRPSEGFFFMLQIAAKGVLRFIPKEAFQYKS
jgi:hypothetical protein